MRIRTQFVVTVLLFGVLLAAISASAIGTNYQVSQAGDQAALARRIAQGAGELSYLANDYVIYRESQQLERWHDRFDAFAADAAALRPGNPEEQVVALNLQNNALRLKGVFGSVVSLVESSSTGQAEPIDPALLQVAWSRIAVQTQGLMSDASRLSQLLSSRVDRLQRTNSIVVVALITLFSAYFFSTTGSSSAACSAPSPTCNLAPPSSAPATSTFGSRRGATTRLETCRTRSTG